MPGSLLPYSGRKPVGLGGKAKWTGNLVWSRSSFFVLFALLVLATNSMQAEWEGMETLGNCQTSPSPVRAAVTYHNLQSSPKNKCLKLLLPSPRGDWVGLGKTRTIPFTTFLPVEISQESICPAPVCPTAPTPPTAQTTCPWGKRAHRQIKGFRDVSSCLQKYCKFPCMKNGKLTSEAWRPSGAPLCAATVLH